MGRQYGLFAFELRATVDAERSGTIVFAIRRRLLTIENVVSRDVNKWHLAPPCCCSELTRTVAVDNITTLRFGLGLVNGRIRGGIDDNLRRHGIQHAVYRFRLLDVKVRA